MLRDGRQASRPWWGAAFPACSGVALTVAACVTTPPYQTEVPGPHGEHLVEMHCSAAQACLDLAGKTCKGGYKIISSKKVPGFTDAVTELVECNPYVANSAIMGPHGETLIEIDCMGSVETCFGFARKTCNGDYDIFMSSPFLIQCAQPMPPPEFPLVPAPDAGALTP